MICLESAVWSTDCFHHTSRSTSPPRFNPKSFAVLSEILIRQNCRWFPPPPYSSGIRWIIIFFPVKSTKRSSQSPWTGPVRAVAYASGTNTQETIRSSTAPIHHSQTLSGNFAQVPARAATRQRIAAAPGPRSDQYTTGTEASNATARRR